MIETLTIGILAACLTVFINYIIGKPGSKEFSANEIFSLYSIWLSKRRLKQVGLWKQYISQYNENFIRLGIKCSSKECRFDNKIISLKNDFRKVLYNAAEPFFTWEKAVGMCPVCFGFWVSLICGICLTGNVVDLLTIVVVSHVTIRILNKIL